MGRSKRSLTNPVGSRSSSSATATVSHNRSASTVAERAPQLPEIDLEPLDFAVLREKRASIATNPETNYGLDMFDVRLSYNAARRSLIRDKDELPIDFSALGEAEAVPAVPQLPADLRTLHSSKMKEVLGMDPGEETEVERDGSYTPESILRKSEAEKEEEQVVPEYIHGWRLVSVMVAITLACFLYLLDVSILVTAIPKITSDFHSLTDIGWYGATYNLASAALQPLSGKFYTYFHAKWTFLAFFLVFELGNLLCGVATSSTMIIIGRTVAGAGASGLTNGSFAIVTACAPMEKRPQLMGILIGVCQMGLVAGPLIGGALTEFTSWRWCFYINLPVGAVTVVAFLVTAIPDKRRYVQNTGKLTLRTMDVPGFALFAPAAVMILLALEFGGGKFAWSSPTIIGLFVGGGVEVVLFLLWERRAGMTAMIPLPIIGKREVWTACVASMFMFSTMLGAGYYLPVYFQTVRGMSPLRSGVSMLPAIVTQLVATVVCGGVVQRVGYYLPFMVVSAVIIAVANGLLSTWGPHTGTLTWAGYQVLLGVGRGMAFQMPVIAIQAHTPPALASVATATMVLFQTFFGSVFLAIINTLFNTKLKQELNRRLPEIGADKIINAGAADIKSVVSADKIAQVLEAYSLGVNEVFYAIAAICVCMFIFSWGTGWTDIRRKPEPEKGQV
ncbi:Major facilitator superfamily domain, general substrate transporter [Cordyceps fumosorosea ARSEF 2679]|uniref:Major facilitator superfamily domain, general substrate transporter n=1 Tax=Cordyceps fumosorosea (strain ARSEF 2679) TaxID=1081104 RepID=A0A168CFF8_CORFA|nr:Major facilitator superfamily domain, general substrate transporter [Cordyceps fumosorosea ARSEF 2679]OAA71310.1 Major facilitator superfamily domain, general substrate transporter [Cordyceps fumosorosea ARSEF 2679]